MLETIKGFTNFLEIHFHRRLQKINSKRAVALSVAVHMLFGAALANFYVQSYIHQQANQTEEVIEFDLTTIESHTDLSQIQAAGVPNAKANSDVGKASTLVKGNMNRKTMMMASLSGLEELKSSFNFIMQKTATDSLGGFSPADGNVPGSEYDSFGYRKGENLGRGNGVIVISGGGFCAPSPAPPPGK